MSIKVSRQSEASLGFKGNAVQVSATYEVHLTDSDLKGLALHADKDGIPGAIETAITSFLNNGGTINLDCKFCPCGACPGFWETCTCPHITHPEG